ncbi:MAG: TIGR02597 family protein [Verrucomicrobiota bacterium]
MPRRPVFLALLAIFGLSACGSLVGAGSSGSLQLDLLGNSDTIVSLPFVRPKAASGLVQSVSGSVVNVTGPTGWSTGQFVYSSGIQTNTHYVIIRSGAKEGFWYFITANDSNSVTLDLVSDTLSGLNAGDQFDIIPYWTLATIFTNEQGINASPTPGNRTTEVFVQDVNAVGIDLTASRIYYFWSGSWRQVGQGAANKNDDIILPCVYLIVRHNIAGDTTLTLQGSEMTSKWAVPLAANPSTMQDNPVSLSRPVQISLTQSGLFEGGAFNASPNFGNPTDELFTFDNTLAGIDKTATATYYYWNGAWRRIGAVTDVGSDLVFSPNVGVIIRKSIGPSPGFWINSLPNTPPSVNLTSPANGATFTAPATIVVGANASDSDGTVTQVEYYDGATLIGTATVSPYNYSWNNLSIGQHILTAKATDNSGAFTTSGAVTIAVNSAPPVNQPPVVDADVDQTITLPSSANLVGSVSDDGLPMPPGAVTVSWSQINGPGTVTFANADLPSTGANFSTAGTYVLELKANDGALVSSAEVTITVNPEPNIPPTVSVTSPFDGASFSSPASFTLAALANDNDGSVAKVDFFSGTSLIATVFTSPFSIPLSNVGADSYMFTARATDNGGATSTSSAVTVTVNSAPPPANDNFANAQVITGSSGAVSGDNLNASVEPGEPFHAANMGGHSVWYAWTAATSNQTLLDTLGSDFDTLLAVYVGNGVSLLDLVGSNNDIDPSTPSSRLSFTSVAGTTYYIAVDGADGVIGQIALNWSQTQGPPPPANDGFATALVVTGTAGSLNGTTANATEEPGEPNHAGLAGGKSVWYQWTAPTGNSATFDTFGSPFDTLLAVYTGDSVAALNEIASNNDLDTITKQSRVNFTPIAGTNYFIAVDGLNDASGNFVLSWNQSGLGHLPDLLIWANSSTNYQITNKTFLSTDCAVVEGLVQAGARRLLIFTTETRNAGDVDWFVGNPAGNPEFVWAPCHGHYHFNDYMQYRLLDSAGNLVAPGYKVGFCLTDSLRWSASANSSPKYHCGLQGIQQGWADVYTYLTPGQWVDITGVPDGYYTLEMTVNPSGRVQESDYSNNTGSLPITIGHPPPPNDNFNAAQILSGTSGTVGSLTVYGTKEPGEPNHAANAGGRSVWYTWTAVNNQAVIFDTIGSSINTLLAVYTGSSVGGLTLVAANDEIGGVGNKVSSRVIILNPVAGTVYQIAVDGYNGAFGNIKLNWSQRPPPANDNFANAQLLSSGAGSVNGDNLLATKETGEPKHTGNAGGSSIWYQWSASADGSVTIDTLGSDFDTMLAVYTGTAYGALTTVAGNDDIGGGGSTGVLSRVTFTANVGGTYMVAVDGYSGKKGNVTLNWNQPNGGQPSSLRSGSRRLAPASVNKPVPTMLSCSPVSTGGVLLSLRGEPNQVYTLEFSTDLADWMFLHSFQVDGEGKGIFVDRSKPAGRANLLDPWCGDPNDKVYIAPMTNGSGTYYRAVTSRARDSQ